jgi:DMSO/TMAO reductase YedYZ molybdopterin-dependent catalytic subunit
VSRNHSPVTAAKPRRRSLPQVTGPDTRLGCVRETIFRLLETGDNFIKYAAEGRQERAAHRAREKFERAADLAESLGDPETLELVRIRLADLQRRHEQPEATVGARAQGAEETPVAEPSPYGRDRVPPGQRVKKGWPVLHEGPIPGFDPAVWRLRVWGAAERPLELSYEELHSLPDVTMTSDFHCVTGWSRLENRWLGVRVRDVLAHARPDGAHHVLVHAEYDYTANLPIETLLEDDALLAWGHEGRDLEPKHGWPLRLVVPKLYGWKSVKWVRGVELLERDRRGFWEVRGYHNRADPWQQKRYAYQE